MPTVMSINEEKEYPVIPIRNGVVFPHTESVLVFGRSRSVSAIEKAYKENTMAVVVMQKDPNINEPTAGDLYTVGSLIKVEKLQRNTDDRGRVEINALIEGVERVQIVSFESAEPYLSGKVVAIPEGDVVDDEIRALCKHLSNQLRRAVSLGKSMDFISFMKITSGLSPVELANQIAAIVDTQPQDRQQLLEENDLKIRLNKIAQLLSAELRVLEIEKNIDSKTQKKFDQNFRKTVLEERLKTIEKELGKDGENREVKELFDKIKEANMPKHAEKKAKRELKRLSQMSNYNPEASYLRSYLDWLVEVPWKVAENGTVEMKKAEAVLDQDHYGLKKVKERIIEYLAVIKLKNARKPKKDAEDPDATFPSASRAVSPTILCLVGPPGVGKTSIGRSIARALDRKFVKISLGGIRDEAEIRGHRRTYVGALPGRIIQGMKNAGTTNPVFMLDEIDKLGNDFRGDPSSALLEALDPEQNFAFEDHYMEVAYDLSNVFFITTANILDTIPPALRDRLEIIRFSGYTEDEKFNIAKKYLITKQEEVHALADKEVTFTDNAVRFIINRYTREAGVRNLEREIAKVMRKVARKIAEGMTGKFTVGVTEITKFLGPERFSSMLAEKKDEVGMVTGLAWTESGGEILFIEVALMPGKGSLLLTGQLGDVMKESCQAAMSYVRTRWQELGLKKDFYHGLDVHVHVPEGAVPKDGPSAGLAITTALVSALTKTPVNRLIGMTGEVTLRGRALEIGGVKEKFIAAHRAGLKEIIMPKDNKKDLEDVPQNVIRDLKFHYVRHVDEVLKLALLKDQRKLNGHPKRKNKIDHSVRQHVRIPISA